ncbi:UNKNOWN [Stylonychia lemnae]|uniref:Uncharacterized protein n=1 Tax=Stylonychia lemnae TaxID=5949 RepID=A0A077ZY66_STYLE|nr:UNKNOWN [Stylonychia lemnae]|eukprot:CDW73491.1 UNKNOWN [Stylonychia lemnae]
MSSFQKDKLQMIQRMKRAKSQAKLQQCETSQQSPTATIRLNEIRQISQERDMSSDRNPKSRNNQLTVLSDRARIFTKIQRPSVEKTPKLHAPQRFKSINKSAQILTEQRSLPQMKTVEQQISPKQIHQYYQKIKASPKPTPLREAKYVTPQLRLERKESSINTEPKITTIFNSRSVSNVEDPSINRDSLSPSKLRVQLPTLVYNQSPEIVTLKNKKPYLQFDYIEKLQNFIFYDRYRFQIGSEAINDSSINRQMQKLRKSDDIIYLNYQRHYYQGQILILTKDKRFYIYDLAQQHLQDISSRMPKLLMDKIVLPKIKSGFSNKISQGKPKFELLNNFVEFELYQSQLGFLFKDGQQSLILFLARDQQHPLILVEDYDDFDFVEWKNNLCIQSFKIKNDRVKIQSVRLSLKDENILKNITNASFHIEMLKPNQSLENKTTTYNQFLKIKFAVMNKNNLRMCIGLNTEPDKFYLFLIDVYQTKSLRNALKSTNVLRGFYELGIGQ